jgi:hypothetical protein
MSAYFPRVASVQQTLVSCNVADKVAEYLERLAILDITRKILHMPTQRIYVFSYISEQNISYFLTPH